MKTTEIKSNYKISPVTVYDDEQEMWGTKIGRVNREMSLLYTAWGTTENNSRELAKTLVEVLDALDEKLKKIKK